MRILDRLRTLIKSIMRLKWKLILILVSVLLILLQVSCDSSNGQLQDCVPTVSQKLQLTEDSVSPLIEPLLEPEIETTDVWGTCRVTAYCSCEKCCGKYALNRPKDENGNKIVYGAAGIPLTSYRSCASSLPLGTVIYIHELDMEFVVEDRAAKWIDEKYDGMYVDIYIDDHQACWDFIRGQSEWMEVQIMQEVK